MTKTLTCIICPLGCQILVDTKDPNNFIVTQNKCKRGIKYAKTELINPVRMLTTTIRINSKDISMAPVRTQNPIPKNMVFECLKELKKLEVKVPVKIGDIVVKNICQTGINVIATRNILK